MRVKKYIYIIYGNNKALELYNQSLETLLESDCFDFDVKKISKQSGSLGILENVFELDGYIIIDDKHMQIFISTYVRSLKNS